MFVQTTTGIYPELYCLCFVLLFCFVYYSLCVPYQGCAMREREVSIFFFQDYDVCSVFIKPDLKHEPTPLLRQHQTDKLVFFLTFGATAVFFVNAKNTRMEAL